MRKFIWIICLLLSGLSLRSQNTNTYLNNYVQPAPNVAALGKYADYPVSYYTGVPEISVPVYELQDGAVHIPISLSYHASGIRVAELASWVGLGWALNAGGAIIRTVRGAPDEGSLKGTGYAKGPRGYYVDSGLKKLPMLPYPVNGFIEDNEQNWELRQFTIPYVNAGSLDCEPDLYFFNFNGYTGKFVFDENRTPRLLTDGDLRIQVNYSYSPNEFTSWVITTPDGVRYCFGENNMHETTLPHSTLSGDDIDSHRPSSWYLTRIIYPNTKDTAYFSYVSENYSYHDLGPESKTFGTPGSDITWACNGAIPKSIITTTIQGLRLSSIQTRNYTVSFVANTSRQDVIVNSSCNMLDTVRISTAAGECIKQVVLNHGYFNSTTATGVDAGLLSFLNDNTDTKRLKLLSIKEYSGDLSISKPAYTFTYNETLQLPRRMSYDQDHWGFSNNSTGNRNTRLTPIVDHPICFIEPFTDPSRNPHYPDMAAFSLHSLRDPLGALTTFALEAHNEGKVGGLRIKQIITRDSVTGKEQVRSFSYMDGVVYKQPKYFFILNNEYYLLNGLLTVGYRGYGNPTMITHIIRQSSSAVPMQDFNGNHIGYTMVTETIGPNGEGGRREYHFLNTTSPLDNSRLDMSNYTATSTIGTFLTGSVTGLFGNGHFNDLDPASLTYYSKYDVDNYYPAAPQQVDIRRGKLLYEFDYDSSGTLVKKIENNYENIYHEWMPIRGFKAAQADLAHPDASGQPITMTALTYYKLHTGIAHLISTITTDYKDGRQFVTKHSYQYEDTLHTLPTGDTWVNSSGDTIVQKTYYSYDFANGATGDNVFGKMKNLNMLLPVATRVWKNGQLISGTIKEYKDFAGSGSDTFINPAKVYSLETTSPLSVSAAGESISFSSPFSTLVPNGYFREKADFNYDGTTGKIIEQKLTAGKDEALIWDHTLSRPLAQASNAYYADVAFSSFESAEKGNWSYNQASVATDATAPTGTHVYILGGTAISKSGLSSSTKYVVSWWQKSGASVTVSGGTQSNALTGSQLNGYTYKEVQITGATSVSVNGSGLVDEVRLFPSAAQMTTYTYDPMLRLVASCSPNGTISYFEYDGLHRPVAIRDQYGNIRKAFEYHFGRESRSSQ